MTPTEQDNELLNADDDLFNPVLHAKLWEIVKRFHDHPDGSYEGQAVEDLTKLYHADRKKHELEARIDELKKLLLAHGFDSDETIEVEIIIQNRIAELKKELDRYE